MRIQENKQLIIDIKDLECTTQNKYSLYEGLIKKGHSEIEIKNATKTYNFKKIWNGNIIFGLIFIFIAVLLIFTMNSYMRFEYEFDSSVDFYRLNESILKPFLIISLLIIGINIFINKGFFSESLRILMLFFSISFLISTIISGSLHYSILIPIVGLILIISFSIIKLKKSNFTDEELILNNIKHKKKTRKEILALTSIKKWKGSSLFIFFLLSFILLLNSPIALETKIDSISFFSKPILTKLESILISILKVLILGSLLVSILININFKKFRISVIILGSLSLSYVVLTFFHKNFQTSIIPCIIIIIASAIYLIKEKTFANNQ